MRNKRLENQINEEQNEFRRGEGEAKLRKFSLLKYYLPYRKNKIRQDEEIFLIRTI
jgi:hypothetical protein